MQESKATETPVYYGSVSCDATTGKGKPCTNRAYYRVNENGKRERPIHYRCGVHSKRAKRRVLLDKDPDRKRKQAELLQHHASLVEAAAEANRPHPGRVIVTKLRMMQKPEHHDGFLKVFPNYRHGNRSDGFGCASLSPKSLGPIHHGMSGLPVALNLENYHQAAKVFPHEVDACGNLTDAALELRKQLYADPEPHRHKFPPQVIRRLMQGDNANIPLCSVYYDRQGGEHRYSYLECRYFYCHWYEKLVPAKAEFQELQRRLSDGYNLQIVGYDGYPVTQDLYEHYTDTTKPFGHELVLYTLLVVEDPKDYPWNRYYREHPDIYDGVI
jgi:hypothetical protein